MAKCKNCSAQLPPHSGKCEYCGTVCDIDLKGVHEYTTSKPSADRICPRCNKILITYDLDIDGKFFIERCDTCMGIFFDPGELEYLLENTVENVFEIKYKELADITKKFSRRTSDVQYVKCPVCQEIMNRINFGTRSGVIIDSCKTHGVWLDGGELKQLLEWRKAGGELLHEKRELEKIKEKEKTDKKEKQDRRESFLTNDVQKNYFGSTHSSRGALINVVSDVIFRFFR